MSCTEVLNVFSSRHIPSPSAVPVDIAMRICLSHSPPVRGLLSYREFCGLPVGHLQPLRPCLNPKSEPGPAGRRREPRHPQPEGAPKRVVFADAKGLSLTAVRVFSEFEDELSDLQFELSDLAGRSPGGIGAAGDTKLAFDGPQPSADGPGFRARLEGSAVALETCGVRRHTLSGKVQVRNLGFEKSVCVRITFDTWKSFRDVACSYTGGRSGPGESDTFAFHLSLPQRVPPHERVEFCVRFQCGHRTYWDNCEGQNYRLVASGFRSTPAGKEVSARSIPGPGLGLGPGHDQQLEFEQFGSPRATSVLFSQWQSWGRFDYAGFW